MTTQTVKRQSLFARLERLMLPLPEKDRRRIRSLVRAGLRLQPVVKAAADLKRDQDRLAELPKQSALAREANHLKQALADLETEAAAEQEQLDSLEARLKAAGVNLDQLPATVAGDTTIINQE